MELPAEILKEEISDADLDATIDWSLGIGAMLEGSRLNGISDFNELLDATLLAAARRSLSRPDLLGRIGEIIRQRIDVTHRVLLSDSEVHDNVLLSHADVRRQLLSGSVAVISDAKVSAYGAYLVSKAATRPEDLPWLCERSLTSATEDEATAWAQLARMTFDPGNAAHDECFGTPPGTILYDVAFSHWREAVPLDGEYAVMMRSHYQSASPQESDDERLARHLVQVNALLSGDQGDDFVRLFAILSMAAEEDPTVRSLDLRRLSGWALVKKSDFGRVSDLAAKYLRTQSPSVPLSEGHLSITYGTMAAIAALLWLESEAPEPYSENLRQWMPALVRGCGFSFQDNSRFWEVECSAYGEDSDDFLQCVSDQLVGATEAEFLLAQISDGLDDRALGWLSSLVMADEVADGVAAQALLHTLGIAPFDGQVLLDSVLSSDNRPRAVIWAAQALKVEPRLSWESVWARVDSPLAKALILRVADSQEFDLGVLLDEEIVQLWEMCLTLFPPSEDPDVVGVHEVSKREEVGHFRDRLLPFLSQRGTATAVGQLQQLAARHKEMPYIRLLWAEARRQQAKNDWTPLEFDLLLTLLCRAGTRVLASSGDLLLAVIGALREIEYSLSKGETPEATLLWNHGVKDRNCRPKSEDDLNDYIARNIARKLKGVVVNREVEVNRRQQSGIGQRPDILISAHSANVEGEILRLAVEGKGVWNGELFTALKTQLLDLYLSRLSGAAGLLLAYWFEPEHYSSNEPWMTDPLKSEPGALHRELATQAAAVPREVAAVETFVLRVELGWRPVR